MFSESDRVWIRHYAGYSALFLQADPRLENAITSIQAISEGGQRPDSSSENMVKAWLYGSAAQSGATVSLGPTAQNVTFAIPATQGLIAIETQLSAMWPITYVKSADNNEAAIDTARGIAQLRSEGRRLASAMARMLGMNSVRADMFSPGQPIVEDDPFTAGSKQNWL